MKKFLTMNNYLPVKLSILIPTLRERRNKFAKLKEELTLQKLGKPVELLINEDQRQKTTGRKRNELLSQATGEYIVFVDDDDRISHEYVNKLLKGIESGKDCVLFNVQYNCKEYERKVIYSLKYHKDQNLETHFERIPNHLSCVKRDLALKAKFPNKTFGEDVFYSRKLKPYLKTAHYINDILYYYDDFKH